MMHDSHPSQGTPGGAAPNTAASARADSLLEVHAGVVCHDGSMHLLETVGARACDPVGRRAEGDAQFTPISGHSRGGSSQHGPERATKLRGCDR